MNFNLINYLNSDKCADFKKFLSNSSINPVINYPFSKEELKYFQLMDFIAESLVSNVLFIDNKPLFSIIMPTYNRENLIMNAIKSVLNQTYTNFELIIIDDGSIDNTLNLLNNIEDDRIKIISSSSNNGVSHARNLALKESKGDYIAYLDSDNDWHPNYLKAMLGAFLELEDADAIYCGQFLFKDNLEQHPNSMRFASFNKSLLRNRNFIDLNCFCHKKEIYNQIGGFDENLKRLVDWDYIVRIDEIFNIYSIPVILSNYYYANADNRISNTVDLIESFNKLDCNFKDLDDIYEINQEFNELDIIIFNFESLNNLKICVDSILTLDLENINLNFVLTPTTSQDILYYINSLGSQINCFNIETSEIKDIFNFILSQFDKDVLILDSNAILNKKALEIMHYYLHSIDNCGMVVPQKIIPKNNNVVQRYLSYSFTELDCDIMLSPSNSSIKDLPILHNGKFKELKEISFFCLYIKKEVFKEISEFKLKIESYDELTHILSFYLRYVIYSKVYYIAGADIYFNI